MTGAKFKQTFKTRHGTKWVKHTSQELACSKATIHRLAIMATIPPHYERKIGEILRKPA